MRADRSVPSASRGSHLSIRVSHSTNVAVSRLCNTPRFPRSRMASRPYLCESRSGGKKIDSSDPRLCIMLWAEWYKVANPVHESGVRETRRRREGRFPRWPHSTMLRCSRAFHRGPEWVKSGIPVRWYELRAYGTNDTDADAAHGVGRSKGRVTSIAAHGWWHGPLQLG